MIDKGGDCYANFFVQITYFVIYMRISACRDVVLIPCGNIQAICKGNLILKMEVKSKEGMGKQIMHKDFMFAFFCRIVKAGWLPAGKLIKRKVASSQVRNANPRCWHVAKKEDGCH